MLQAEHQESETSALKTESAKKGASTAADSVTAGLNFEIPKSAHASLGTDRAKMYPGRRRTAGIRSIVAK